MEKFILKTLTLLLIVALNWSALSVIGETLAYFFDNEDSGNNLFQASILDFSVTNRHVEGFIGMEATSEIESVSVITKTTGSMDVQYEVRAEKISGNDDFCNALQIELEHNGIEKHDGPLLSVNIPVTTYLGTWELELDLPIYATNIPHGAECNVDLIFNGWRSDVVNFEDSGFTDEERIELRLTSRMIVLNEFLPNPEGEAYGFDFGDDSSTQPRGEWVELYNNSDISHDLTGWYIWDASGDDLNKIFITNSNTWLETTTISGRSWLVVYMNKEVLDNTGDTVKLFDISDTLVDFYSYGLSDYCDLEPTLGDTNDETASGSCPTEIPGNKSYARIPDGIGYWVDPIPTPGGANRLIEEEIKELESEPEEVTELEQEELVSELIDEVIEEPGEEPISDEIFDEIVGNEEPVEEPFGSAQGEEPIIEESLVNEEAVSEELTTEEEPPIEETQATEEEPITEEAPIIEEDPIEEEVSAIGDEITTEETNETSGETTDDVIEELTEEVVEGVVEETPLDEIPATEPVESPSDAQADEAPVEASVVDEQPVAIPDDSSSIPDGAGGSVSDGESGGGEIGVSSDGGSSVEGAGESSGDGVSAGDTGESGGE